jgi:hypothetical protein
LNAIKPKDIKTIFEDKISHIIKILYVRIKHPEKKYLNELNMYINYYYAYKESVGVKTSRKIDEYIDVLQNEKNSNHRH